MKTILQVNRVKIVAAVLVMGMVLGLAAPGAAGNVIYEEKVSEPVARGVTYQQTWSFTSLGWLRVHVLEVDLTEPSVDIDLLYNQENLGSPKPLTEMAREQGAVAAINADFFYQRGSYTVPVGPMVTDGKLLASPGSNQELGVAALTKGGEIHIGPWIGQGQLRLPGAQDPIGMAAVNKPGTDYTAPYLFTEDWGAKTPATPPGVVTLVGKGSQVLYISDVGEQEIPPGDGFALVTGGRALPHFRNLRPGDNLEITFTTTPNWQDYLFAVGGGGILLSNGQVMAGGHQVAGQHPRSALGVSADGKTLYLVTVDGRQDASRGLEQQELAKIMLEVGAHNAINLDGGGSSTMVARTLGSGALEVRNTLSGGQRSLPNGIGIFSKAPVGTAQGLVLTAEDTNVPLEGTRTLKLAAYDGSYNPVSLPQGDTQWEVEPAGLGRVEGGVFYPNQPGQGTVTARLGNLETEISLRVIGPTVELKLTPERAALKQGESRTFTVVARDAAGYRARVEGRDLTWEPRGEIGTLTAGRLEAGSQSASGAVVARMGDVQGGALVTVGREQVVLHSLADPAGLQFLSWPQEVPGRIQGAAPPQALPDREGQVIKLEYNFSPEISGTRAAYLVLGEEGIQLHPDAQAVGLWVYGDGRGHWLRGMVADANGQQTPIDFARRVDWEGWRYVEASLPANAVSLRRVYLTEPDSTRGGQGAVYFANLQAEMPLTWRPDLLPGDEGKDPARLAAGDPAPAGPKFLVVGNLNGGVEKEKVAAALEQERKRHGAQYIVATDSLTLSGFRDLGIGSYPTALTTEGNPYFFLTAAGGGLRAAKAHQWPWLQSQLAAGREGDNAFVILDRVPFKTGLPVGTVGFSNSAEAQLLRQTLTGYREETGGEVWVLAGGTPAGQEPWWQLVDGVRYLGIPGVSSFQGFSYLVVTLGPDGPVYSFHKAVQ